MKVCREAATDDLAQHRRDRVANQQDLFGLGAEELEFIRERLEPRTLAEGQVAILRRVNELRARAASDRLARVVSQALPDKSRLPDKSGGCPRIAGLHPPTRYRPRVGA